MATERKSLDALEAEFARGFRHFDLRLPASNVLERRKGSMPYGGSGRLYYVFGEEDGREYLEYYAYHRMGESHGKIYDDGSHIDLPELGSMFGYDPNIPGDEERKEAEMRRRYRETLDDLIAKGLFDDEPFPKSLAINSHLVLHGDEMDRGSSE
jgi:hypothetical protein